ncbi:MAG: carboxypeptidase-like regulatory domain-containing protein [Steroidobacteraceae bacterium]|nr:carboxypeptidase-like regulatory domain-containing protein [Steroidobacteraceae bacterium]
MKVYAALVSLFLSSWVAWSPALAQSSVGGLSVRVTRSGVPVPSATVCVGTANDGNLFYQATTDAQGRVNFPRVPANPFVVTARRGDGGAQRAVSPATLATPPVLSVALALPLTGGPSCPTTPAGPQRTVALRDFVLPSAPPVTTVQLQNNQRCFGAIGAQCGQIQGNLPATALCASGTCFVNPGSWDHDECCFSHPRGMACQAGPIDAITGHDGNCVTSWDKAVRLATTGLNWSRRVDFARANGTGTVEFDLYCAPANALLPPADGAKCCSRQTRSLTPAEAAVGVTLREALVACR